MADLSVYGKLQGFGDYQRANEEFQLRKGLIGAKMADAFGGGKQSAAEEKIDRLVNTLGVDRATAVSIADGAVKVVTDPMTNQPFMVNVATGSQQALSPGGGLNTGGLPSAPSGNTGFQPPMPSPSQPKAQGARQQRTSLYELADDTAGPGNALLRGLNPVAGWMGSEMGSKQTTAATTMVNAQNELVSSLQFNPKYAEGERENLKNEISISPKGYSSAEQVRARMRSVDTSIRQRLADAERDANDPTLPLDTRQMAAHNASKYRNFLPRLDAPQQGAQPSGKRSLDEIFGN